MGSGIVAVCSPQNASKLTKALPEARVIGEVMKQKDGQRVVID